MSDTTLYTGDNFYLLCMCSTLFVRFFCKAYVMLALAFLRKSFNLLFSVVPDISACIYTENKGLTITEVLKNYWRKESMTFSGENTSLFFPLQKFPNASIV